MTQNESYGRKIINIKIDTSLLAMKAPKDEEVQVPPTNLV
jgi:hypothetical protein